LEFFVPAKCKTQRFRYQSYYYHLTYVVAYFIHVPALHDVSRKDEKPSQIKNENHDINVRAGDAGSALNLHVPRCDSICSLVLRSASASQASLAFNIRTTLAANLGGNAMDCYYSVCHPIRSRGGFTSVPSRVELLRAVQDIEGSVALEG
jgi:hypothetical protein